LLGRYGIKHETSVPYAPHTNGAVERLNQTIRTKLATVCHNRTKDWDKEIYFIVAQYNRTPHSGTNKAPVEFFNLEQAELNVPEKFKQFKIGDKVLKKVAYQVKGQRDKLAPKHEGPYVVIKAFPDL